jgi:hypothetical protein
LDLAAAICVGNQKHFAISALEHASLDDELTVVRACLTVDDLPILMFTEKRFHTEGCSPIKIPLRVVAIAECG